MKKQWLKIAYIPFVFLCVLIIAALPIFIRANQSTVYLDWSSAWYSIQQYVSGLGTGQAFQFMAGQELRNFFDEVPAYIKITFTYLIVSALLSFVTGSFFGILMARTKAKWLKEWVEMLGAIPDFTFIILLQFFVVYFYKQTGILIGQVGSFSADQLAILLPIISMTVIPAIYLIRNVSLHVYQIITEEYILHAKAKGLKKRYIYTNHVMPNLIPFLKADLNKFLAIMMGNLFIVEYLFNLPGLTKLLFVHGLQSGGYKYNLVVDCFICLLILYFILNTALRGLVWLLERKFAAHE